MPTTLAIMPGIPLPQLRADCSRCAALCCVAFTFTRSADFAIDKPAGQSCPNLTTTRTCGIHSELRRRGFPACTAYDCFGAGQQVTQVTLAGFDWADSAQSAREVFATFGVVQQLHELLWYLSDAEPQLADGDLRSDFRSALDETARLADGGPNELRRLDLNAHRAAVDALLARASRTLRREYPDRDHRRADLIGKDLRDATLDGADLRGALLLGADLRGASLRRADFIEADLRGANLGGLDLSSVLFLTAGQVGSALGDEATALPYRLIRPDHWS
jgi:uncharacterized protein YjbI with pentapeptide repeats